MRVLGFDTPARCARGLLNQRYCRSRSADAQRLRVSRPVQVRVLGFDTPVRFARGLLNQRCCWSSSADAQRLRVSRPSQVRVTGFDTRAPSSLATQPAGGAGRVAQTRSGSAYRDPRRCGWRGFDTRAPSSRATQPAGAAGRVAQTRQRLRVSRPSHVRVTGFDTRAPSSLAVQPAVPCRTPSSGSSGGVEHELLEGQAGAGRRLALAERIRESVGVGEDADRGDGDRLEALAEREPVA